MSGDAVDTADTVTTEIASTVEPAATTNDAVLSEIKDVKELLNKILGAVEIPDPAVSETSETSEKNESAPITEPGDGETIRDKSPASDPWTHKRPLKWR